MRKGEPQKPAKSMKERTVDQIYEYLLRHGEKTPAQLAKSLRLDPATVRNALKELRKQDKIRLERPLFLQPTPARVVPSRVPERIKRKVEEQLEKARAIQLKVHEKQEEIKRRREQLLKERHN